MDEVIGQTVSYDSQVSVHDSSLPSGQYVDIENTERDIVNISTTDGIPCEHCNAQISLNDWEDHSKQCADAHKNSVENPKNNNEAESVTTLIPCEYCDAQVSVHDWEWHSRQCADTYRRGASNTTNNINESMNECIPCEYCGDQNQCEKQRIEDTTKGTASVLIPCEYCADYVSVQDWTLHSNRCAETEKRRIENLTKDTANDLIPCEYCDKCFTLRNFEEHRTECHRKQLAALYEPNGFSGQIFGGIFPKSWDLSSPYNLSRYILELNSDEYQFVADNFHKSLTANEIVQIERIQNRRWYRQYDAHKDDFIERYGKSTEQWLFHGCKSQSVAAIINDCFNRSHAVRYAAGQGIYFATQSATSYSYTQPDSDNIRHMFMARVLVGKTTAGDQSTRVCPPGYDTTGGGAVFVTYHDAQAYGEYLIAFR